jgi:hypothetical protein
MRKRLLLPLVALLTTSALTPALAQTFSLTQPAVPAPVATPTTATTTATATAVDGEPDLRRLSMASDAAFLQGESAAREWPMYVKASDIGRVAALQVAFSSSVSSSPTLSRLHVFINDRPVGDIEVKGGEQGALRKIDIPPGLVVPGLNAVRVEFESVHRVDCSVDATYELWARLDPGLTGLVLKPSATVAAATAHDLTDLLTVRISDDGVTPIYIRSPLGPDTHSAERLVRVVNALARNLRLTNPVVTFGTPPKGSAGLELAVGNHAQLADDRVDANGRDRISTSANGGRPLLLLTAEDEAGLDQQAQTVVAELDRINLTGTPAGMRAAAQLTGRAIDGDATMKLGELGFDSGNGRGRRWERSINVSLPQNFVASVYQHATLRLKGAAPGGLLDGSDLRVAVNGVGAASFPLKGDQPIDLEGQTLSLPFSLFHPGINRLTFEAVTVSPEDARCETANHRQRSLVRLSPDTTLSFPHFARLQVGPDVSRMLAVRSDAGADQLHIALVRPDADSLGAAMTMLANLAMQGRHPDVDITYGPPAALDRTGMVFGPIGDLPRELTRTFAGLYTPSSERTYTADDGDASADATPTGDQKPMTEAVTSGQSGLWVKLVRDLRWMGFAFDDPGQRRKLIVRPGDVIVADAPTSGWGVIRAGIAVPSIGATPNSWIVVAADSNEQLAKGVRSFVATGDWAGFSGQASVYDPSSKRVASLSQGRMFYTLPADWKFEDLRDAFAIIFSDHVIAYIGALILLTAMLSAVTVGLLNQRPRTR